MTRKRPAGRPGKGSDRAGTGARRAVRGAGRPTTPPGPRSPDSGPARGQRPPPAGPPADPAGSGPLDRLLQTDAANARSHTPRNLELIRAALAEVGAGRSIVIDETGRVLAGNATVAEARALGLGLKIVDTDERTLVAVRRRDLTADQKTRLALYDNRTGELAAWNADVLSELRDAGELLAGLWTPEELAKALGDAAAPARFVAFGASLETAYRCPACQYEWSGDPRPGAPEPESTPAAAG